MKNVELAQSVLQACRESGVGEVVLCAGARNAPFVSLLSQSTPFKVYSFFEERSASFFALGRILATGRPVAVITTSGTAAAELLPAAIEADYQALPLILITADRPRAFRGCASPQAIIQPGIYSHYVEKTYDLEREWDTQVDWSRRRPIHFNVCFDEPLIDAPMVAWPSSGMHPVPAPEFEVPRLEFKKPLVIVGGLPLEKRHAIGHILARWQRPVYLEGPSNLRGDSRLRDWEITGDEKVLSQIDYDGVIRIGSVPTLKFWRKLETAKTPVMHFSALPFSGLARERKVFALEALTDVQTRFESWTNPGPGVLPKLLSEFPMSEPGWINWFSRQIPEGARLFLGNSLPVREWDLSSERGRDLEIFANRGVNGIDGLISTFTGLAEESHSNWALLGDLSSLYDLTGPWALSQRPVQDWNLVIVNNGGGQIFHRMFNNPLFVNGHALGFEDWARMWKLQYLRLTAAAELPPNRGPRVIEIIPDPEQTAAFWKAWDQA